MRLTFEHTRGDIVELNGSIRKMRIQSGLVVLFGVGLFVDAAWTAITQGKQVDTMPMFLFAGAFITLGVFATRIAGFGAWFRLRHRDPYVIEIDERGLTFIERTDERQIEWSGVRRWYTTRNLIVLVGEKGALAIPKRCCDDAERTELERLLRENLGEAGRW